MSLVFGAGCTGSGPDAQGWYESADRLMHAVAQAVSANDRDALDRMRITREEYMEFIWPQLEFSRLQGWKDNADFIWSQHVGKSDSGLREILRRYGGNALGLQSVSLEGEITDYTTAKIHSKPKLLFDNATAQPPRLAGSLVERAGRYKIFSYNIHR